MNQNLTLAIKEHNAGKCNCDCTEGGYGLCLAGQFLNDIITEEDFNEEVNIE